MVQNKFDGTQAQQQLETEMRALAAKSGLPKEEIAPVCLWLGTYFSNGQIIGTGTDGQGGNVRQETVA